MKHGLSFDLHVNWFQLQQAAKFLASRPALPRIVLNHLGCLKLGSGDAATDASRIAEWREGMRALAAIANADIFVKLSGLEYVLGGWVGDIAKRQVIRGLVRETIELFGADRVMFASNYPVEGYQGRYTLRQLYAAQHDLVADMSVEERRAMFHDNAVRAYKVPSAKEAAAQVHGLQHSGAAAAPAGGSGGAEE